jgi:outer membrane receptor for Fe3+-dicitrate
VTRRVRVAVDTYYKQSVNLIDEGQFGAPIILTPFNYRYGRQYGAEFSASYTGPALQAYLNFAAQRATGKQIDSAQFNFSNADLAYIAHHYIDLDHEQRWTGSGGVSYAWRRTQASLDFLWGSGLRADLALPPGVTTPYGGTGIPNGAHLPYYTQVNVGVSHRFASRGLGHLTARMDVINLFDARYQIRNGTGVGVGAPQYGPRRGVFFGISDAFGAGG